MSTNVWWHGFVPLAATIERMHLAVPRPTNQTAAALLWTYGTLPALSGSTRLAPWRAVGGTTDRLMWRAAGYERPGDKFHAATDRAWWSRAFRGGDELYAMLAEMAKVYDVEHPTAPEQAFRTDIATGVPDALKAYLTLVWETLQAARSKGRAAAPIGVPPLPRVPRPPRMPDQPVPGIPPPPLPIPRGRGGGGVLLLLLLGAVIIGRRSRRR